MMTLIYFILILGIIVLVHETGHFIFAKLCGIYVYEFSIGMGPKIFSFKGKNGETSYSIRAIPLGGFVQLAGEEVEVDTKIPKDRRLQAKPIWQRFLTMFFGAGFNFIFAFILILLMSIFVGSYDYTARITKVEPNYPIANAGIKNGDIVKKIDNHKVTSSFDINMYLSLAKPGKTIPFEIERDKKITKYDIKPVKEKVDGETRYRFGLEFKQEKTTGIGNAIKSSFVKMRALFKQMFVVVKNLFMGQIGISNLSGPVGIYSIVGASSKAGLSGILDLIAYLSINVGFINLLPIPAFDGGRILFLLIEKIKGKPVKPELENTIHSIGFLLLIGLLLFITINDIIKLF
ncbi:MAG: RIP metalloprotease RseP [Bacilli bacterium]